MPERFTRNNPCPICGGSSNLPQGQGRRCYGLYDEKREFARCTREDHAGKLTQNSDGTYSHRLQGECLCGETHGAAGQRAAGGRPGEHRRKTWEIREAGGAVVAEHVRVEYINGTKRFEWWHDGRQGLNGISSKDMLYGLELIAPSPEDRLAVLAEGEKAADALRQVGFMALATVCGAATTPTVAVLGPLVANGRSVVLWPDADDDGRQHMARIAALLERAGARPGQIRIVNWAEAPPKGDAADCGDDRRKELVAAAMPYRSPQVHATDGSGGLSVAERFGLGYRAVHEHGVELELTRIRESREGLGGELLVRWRHGQDERARHIHQARFNLLSGQTRTGTAKQLAGRTPGAGIDWEAILERFCFDVIADVRRPAGRQKVGRMPRQATEYMIDPILPFGKGTIVFGPGGTGKSTLAAAIAVSVQTGREVVTGWRPMSAPVLVLDWEASADDWNARVDQIASGIGIDPIEIEYWPQSRPLADNVHQVSEVVTEMGAGLIIVDSVGLAAGSGREGGDANESALTLFSALREIGVTALLIDHVTGESLSREGAISKPYGGIYKVNMARSVFEIRREKDPEGDAAELVLIHTKVNDGQKLKPMGLRYEYSDDSIRIRRVEVASDDLVKTLSKKDQLKHHLRTGALTTAQLAELTGMPDNQIRAILHKNPDDFERLGNNRIGLKARW
jgi:hypothetical protein